MDKTTEELLDAYGESVNDYINDLVSNKAINEDVRCRFLMDIGQQIFKIGYALKHEFHPNHLENHNIILVPQMFKVEMNGLLQKLQDKHLRVALDNELSKATTDEGRKKIQEQFDHVIKASGVESIHATNIGLREGT